MSIQSKSDKNKFSQLRLSLVQLAGEVRQVIDPFLSNKPVIKGSVYELKRKCGKPGCKCSRGHLHQSMVLSASEKGRTQLRVIAQGFLVEVQIKVRRYQRLRRARARLVEVQRSMLQLMDRMEAMRREEMPRSGKKGS